MRESERGVALLTVLMLVSIVAVVAGSALERLRLSTRLAGNAVAIEQARLAARVGEALAITRIDHLLGPAPDKVTLSGGWSGRPFGFTLPDGGSATARVVDGGNCFNLNGLVTRTTAGTYADNPATRAQFARLMRLTGVSSDVAAGIAAATADWIDSDQDQQAGGAEDNVYLAQSPAYRTAGTLMADPSELRAVIGVTPDLYDRLRPLICTLPVAAPSSINVNTVSLEQAPLLAMTFADGVGVDQAREMILRRPPDGVASIAAFVSGAGGTAPAASGGGAQLGMTTTWFDLQVDVGGTATAGLTEHALLDARSRPTRLVSRYWGEPT